MPTVSELGARVGALLVDEPQLVCAYLFGSFARGTPHTDSDVDIAILFQNAPASTLLGQPFELEADLAKELRRDVQVVVLNSAPVDLVHRVLRDGELIVERDRGARIAFEVKARNEYFDLLPTLRRYRMSTSAVGNEQHR